MHFIKKEIFFLLSFLMSLSNHLWAAGQPGLASPAITPAATLAPSKTAHPSAPSAAVAPMANQGASSPLPPQSVEVLDSLNDQNATTLESESKSPIPQSGQEYVSNVLRKIGFSFIPDSDFMAQVAIAFSLPRHEASKSGIVCLTQVSANRMYRIHSHLHEGDGLVSNPKEIAVYKEFFAKRKGERIRYVAPSLYNDHNSALVTYEATFVAQYYENICFVQFVTNDTPSPAAPTAVHPASAVTTSATPSPGTPSPSTSPSPSSTAIAASSGTAASSSPVQKSVAHTAASSTSSAPSPATPQTPIQKAISQAKSTLQGSPSSSPHAPAIIAAGDKGTPAHISTPAPALSSPSASPSSHGASFGAPHPVAAKAAQSSALNGSALQSHRKPTAPVATPAKAPASSVEAPAPAPATAAPTATPVSPTTGVSSGVNPLPHPGAPFNHPAAQTASPAPSPSPAPSTPAQTAAIATHAAASVSAPLSQAAPQAVKPNPATPTPVPVPAAPLPPSGSTLPVSTMAPKTAIQITSEDGITPTAHVAPAKDNGKAAPPPPTAAVQALSTSSKAAPSPAALPQNFKAPGMIILSTPLSSASTQNNDEDLPMPETPQNMHRPGVILLS